MFQLPQFFTPQSSIQIISVGGLFQQQQPLTRSPALPTRSPGLSTRAVLSPPTYLRSAPPATLNFEFQRKPAAQENVSSDFLKKLISAETAESLKGSESFSKKRKLQNSMRQLFQNFDKKFPNGYPPEKMWEYFFGNDQVNEKRFFTRLKNYLPPSTPEVSGHDLFAALLIPTARQAAKVVELRTVPLLLTKEVFSLAFRSLPFNLPEFPVPRQSQDERKVFDLEETAVKIARTVATQATDLPDLTLSGRLSMEELQVCIGRPLLPLRVIEAGVARVLGETENKVSADFEIRKFVDACAAFLN